MKRICTALLGLLLAVPVYAATEVHEGQKFIFGPTGGPIMLYDPSDSTGHAMQVGGVSGSLSMSDASRDRDNYTYTPGILVKSLHEGPTGLQQDADSTEVIEVGQYRQMWLSIHSYPDSGAAATTALTPGFQFAIQVRFHAGGSVDSTATFALPQQHGSTNGTTGEAIGWGQVGAGSATAAEEYEILVHYFYAPAGDLLRFNGWRTYGFLVPVQVGGTNSIPSWCTHVSFKIRMLDAPGTNAIRMRTTLGLLRAS